MTTKFDNKADFLKFAEDKECRDISVYDYRHIKEYEYLFFEFAAYEDISYYYDKKNNVIIESRYYIGD